ncbi:MAG TPA: phosphatidylserine decarboxylase, partial [Planctomycetia bacterium]|nr:phosphatidylserine decarboxylase [Planctomycetia bacterium]
SFLVSYLLGLLPWPWTWLAWPPFFFSLFVLSFFRDPHRLIPREANVVVSPADGKVTAVEYGKHPFFGEEPIARISIFLSVFNVHVNRMPADALVLRLRYMPGKFLDARNPESGEVNECMEIGCCEQKAPYRKFMVRQVAGAIARRIVTDLAPGERVKRGDRFGMIKFGSRTDLLLPAKDLTVVVKIGDMVKGGETVLAQLPAVESPPPSGPPPSGLTPAEAATTTYFPPPAAAGAYVPPAVEPPASEALHGS